MYNYIRCPNCNNSIGEIYELFLAMKNFKFNEEVKENTDPNRIMLNSDINIELIDIFEILNVKKICCRTKLISICEYDSYLES